MKDGRLEQAGNRWQLHFTRRLPHPPEKVWRALTEPEHLEEWFPNDIDGERKEGAALRFLFRNNEADDMTGEMLVYDPPAILEFTWGPDTLRFELQPEGDGTVLEQRMQSPVGHEAEAHLLARVQVLEVAQPHSQVLRQRALVEDAKAEQGFGRAPVGLQSAADVPAGREHERVGVKRPSRRARGGDPISPRIEGRDLGLDRPQGQRLLQPPAVR